jgi:beta-galactosidase
MQTISLDEKGIRIQGKYQTLLASSLFYFRLPRESWKNRMKILKAAGYNTIDVYFPWNFHEIAPGKWDFEDQKNVEAFLKLAAEQELFVIARPGPYICSEWDGGALPAWLSVQGIPVRQNDPAFLDEIRKWYSAILPKIANYQIHKGGTVICMQIENELDFYQCRSPVSYMEKLKIMAEAFGIEVPLFYCCGQNDLLRGGGLTPGLYTSFNVYSPAETEGLEERALHLFEAVQEREMPFLVTETNREHSYLKRLLVCGAKLLSPYNQTAGSTMDWYNGITNWGTVEKPVALMASDYDFHSMIGAAGEVNGQFYEARLLASLLCSLGEEAAKARPVVLHENGKCLYALKLASKNGGYLVEINNLTEEKCVRQLSLGEEQFAVSMQPMETRLLPYKIMLSDAVSLYGTNYEMAYIDGSNGTEVALYGEGPLKVVLHEKGEVHVYEEQHLEGIRQFAFTLCGISFLVGLKSEIALKALPQLPDIKRSLEEQYTETQLKSVKIADFEWEKTGSISEKPAYMEHYGQYRGIGSYEIELTKETEILLHQAADIITLKRDGQFQETFYGYGDCVEKKLSAGCWEFVTEIWGHSNFDDVRCNSLKMGSLKGIRKFTRIVDRQDITDNWMFDLDEQPVGEWYFFRYSGYNTIMGIDGYNRAVTPLSCVYARWIENDASMDSLILHFEKADCIIWVYVNGHLVSCVGKNDPYVDISEHASAGRMEICLRTLRRYYSDEVGRITLIRGEAIKRCSYSSVSLPHQMKAEDRMREAELPVKLSTGESRVLVPELTGYKNRDVKLFVKGHGVKLTVIHKGHVAGRMITETDGFPVVAGGSRNTVTICGSWLEQAGNPYIICEALEKEAELDAIYMRAYQTVCQE